MRQSYRPDIPPKPQPYRTQILDHLGLVAGSCTSSLRCAVKAVWRNVARPRVYRYPMSPWS
jgi:hypothetical protein